MLCDVYARPRACWCVQSQEMSCCGLPQRWRRHVRQSRRQPRRRLCLRSATAPWWWTSSTPTRSTTTTSSHYTRTEPHLLSEPSKNAAQSIWSSLSYHITDSLDSLTCVFKSALKTHLYIKMFNRYCNLSAPAICRLSADWPCVLIIKLFMYILHFSGKLDAAFCSRFNGHSLNWD